MKKVFLILFIMIFTLSLLLYSEESLNFTGTWKLDPTKSELQQRADRPTPEIVLNINQEDDEIKIETVYTTPRGERETEMSLVIGEKEKKIDSPMMGFRRRPGSDVKSTTIAKAEWSEDGKSLIVTLNTTMSTQRGTFSMKTTSIYSLSEDGKTLTEKQIRIFGDRETESVLVYNKV